MIKRYNYLFFDLDDTLWDFRANGKESLCDIFYLNKLNEHCGSFEMFYQLYMRRNLELWTDYGNGKISKDYLLLERFLYPLRQIGIDNVDLATQMGIDFLDILATKSILKPHAFELLEHCKEHKYPMTIVSNGFEEVQHRKMKSAGLTKYFDHIVLSENSGALKPDPSIFKYALELNGATKEETLMIGDSYEADILGASSYGIDTLFLNNHNKTFDLPKNVTEIFSLKEVFNYI